jgi:hypothetical protein
VSSRKWTVREKGMRNKHLKESAKHAERPSPDQRQMGYLLISLFFCQKSGNELLQHPWRDPATRPFSGHYASNRELYDVPSQKNIRQEETSWETMENVTKIGQEPTTNPS